MVGDLDELVAFHDDAGGRVGSGLHHGGGGDHAGDAVVAHVVLGLTRLTLTSVQNLKKLGNMALLCVRGVRKIFSTSDDAKRVRENSGQVWHHHELEISFGRQEYTVISLLFKLFANLTRNVVKSMGETIIV